MSMYNMYKNLIRQLLPAKLGNTDLLNLLIFLYQQKYYKIFYLKLMIGIQQTSDFTICISIKSD